MSALVAFGSFALSLWISYQLFPFRGDEPAGTGFNRFVVTAIGTTIGVLIANRIDTARSVEREDPAAAAPHNLSASTRAKAGATQTHGFLPSDWSAALSDYGFGPDKVDAIVATAYRPALDAIEPERRSVFRAFTLTPAANVRVVILGQDPYPTRGHANGLAFSVAPGVNAPHSLKRIFSNLESDRRLQFKRPERGGDLTPWAKEGVLLLNASLTVRNGVPRSDSHLWRSFTVAVIRSINARREPTVFLLWGDDANDLADDVGIDSRHRIVRATHPRAEVQSRYPRFADTHPFSAANDFLVRAGRGTVSWTL